MAQVMFPVNTDFSETKFTLKGKNEKKESRKSAKKGFIISTLTKHY
jgi:hypothetical protein